MLQANSLNTTIARKPGAYELLAVNSIVSLFNAPTAQPANETAALVLTACPCCGAPPATDPSFHSRAVVYCNNDDCPRWPQAMGDTVALAAVVWNQRIQDGDLV